ncbi:MAG: hypothetical protein HYY93_09135 [Planctomycetes bacterium]|nr:hypothetical protein [Planctomycetota bacterium]
MIGLFFAFLLVLAGVGAAIGSAFLPWASIRAAGISVDRVFVHGWSLLLPATPALLGLAASIPLFFGKPGTFAKCGLFVAGTAALAAAAYLWIQVRRQAVPFLIESGVRVADARPGLGLLCFLAVGIFLLMAGHLVLRAGASK